MARPGHQLGVPLKEKRWKISAYSRRAKAATIVALQRLIRNNFSRFFVKEKRNKLPTSVIRKIYPWYFSYDPRKKSAANSRKISGWMESGSIWSEKSTHAKITGRSKRISPEQK